MNQSMRMLIIGAGLIPCALVEAQQAPAVIRSVAACRSIAGDKERLACFDRAAAELDAQVASKAVIAVEREQIRREKKGRFGLPPVDGATLADAGEKTPEVIAGSVTNVRAQGEFLIITVAGAGVWQATETSRLDPEPGDAVRLRKGALGGFIMTYGRNRALRVRRLR